MKQNDFPRFPSGLPINMYAIATVVWTTVIVFKY